MLNQSGITKTTGVTTRQIVMFPQMKVSLGIVVNQSAGVTVGEKKIVKAGTPLTGNLDARTTAFTSEVTAEGASNAVGVLEHDVDVTAGNANGTLIIFGFVNKNRMEDSVKTLLTAEVKTALKAKVTILEA